jgi:hypothetical protein
MLGVQHAMNLLGVGGKALGTEILIPGRKVTEVSWDGCMANIRNVRGVGRLVRQVNQRELFPKGDSIDGIQVEFGDARMAFFSLQSVRVVNGELEVWH